MPVLYNLLQLLATLFLLPFLIVMVVWRPKYRSRILRRLGVGLVDLVGLKPKIDHEAPGSREIRIWIHALSVGEVLSVRPLVSAIHRAFPRARLILSVSTKSGEQVARQQLADHVDHLLPAPLDFAPTTRYFVRRVQPDLFILVETDFWPNWLRALKQSGAALLLVNGRISDNSFNSYRRLGFFFRPIFNTFTHLCMQTREDVHKMVKLGIPSHKVRTLGNLKFCQEETTAPSRSMSFKELGLPENTRLLVAGSTHAGEEKIILRAFAQPARMHRETVLLLAPRNIDRARSVLSLARKAGFTVACRTSQPDQARIPGVRVLILDTLGELASCYRLATVAFIGGSLVPRGGHNPLEAACQKVPILFGPYMDDFREIAHELLQGGGAETVRDAQELEKSLINLLDHQEQAQARGTQAATVAASHQRVLERHLELMDELIACRPTRQERP